MRGCIIMLILAVSLASCARMQPINDKYKYPSLPNSTKLYFDIPLNVHVSLFSDENCTLGKYGTLVDYDYYSGGTEVEGYRAKYSYEGKMQSINIETNKTQFINFTHEENKISPVKGTQLRSLCRGTFLFTPQEYHNYVAVYEFKDDHCSATILDLTQSRVSNKFVIAADLRPAAKNCDIYDYYSEYRSKQDRAN